MDKEILDDTGARRLDALLDLDAPAGASPALKERIRAIATVPQIPPTLIVWSFRRLTSYAAMFALIAYLGSWTASGPLSFIAHPQEWIDAALVDTVL
jgi:hypothetical protein